MVQLKGEKIYNMCEVPGFISHTKQIFNNRIDHLTDQAKHSYHPIGFDIDLIL